MNSIVLIIPYFGKWPIWFEAHLLSIEKNPTINWLFITDCEMPIDYPKNVRFVSTSLKELNIKVNTIVGVTVPLTTRKLCDIRPAYGKIFEEYLQDYDFWGFCDVDIIWGDIRKFITEDILNQYDIISSRKGSISGHFTLIKNNFEFNTLYRQIPNYSKLFEKHKFMWFDENVFTDYLKANESTLGINIYWPKILLNQEKGNDSRQEYYLDKWMWSNGKVIDINLNKEVLYLHFINWKKTMKVCEVKFLDSPKDFYISYSKIHYKKHSDLELFLNSIKNVFKGYYSKLRRKKRIKKMKSLQKRIIKKIQKIKGE
jgi:hypothetical protein